MMASTIRWGVMFAVMAAVCGSSPASLAGQAMSLAGPWRFQLDRSDAGLDDRWHERTLPESIRLPGSLPAQGVGDEVTVGTRWTGNIVDRSWFTSPDYEPYRQPGNVKVPFWLQPEKYYVGAAWYQRDVEIPSEWLNKHVALVLERPHWETRVWIDERPAGTCNSLSTPHQYDLDPITPGKHRITIRVDNRMIVNVGENSHSVSDHTQGNWNGIVGRIELAARDGIWIENQRVFPHSDGTLEVEVRCAIPSLTRWPARSAPRFARREPPMPAVAQVSLSVTGAVPRLMGGGTSLPPKTNRPWASG